MVRLTIDRRGGLVRLLARIGAARFNLRNVIGYRQLAGIRSVSHRALLDRHESE